MLKIDTKKKENNINTRWKCFLIGNEEKEAENPIALLKGDILLKDFGIHEGTKICFNR